MGTTTNDDASTWTFTISLDGDDNDDSSLLLPPPPHLSSSSSTRLCNDDIIMMPPLLLPQVPDAVCESFQQDGFAVFPHVLQPSLVHDLNERLEEVLRGRYDRGKKPDKTPRLIKSEYNPDHKTKKKNGSTNNAVGPLGFSGNLQNVKVLQVINVHKSDHLFRKLVTHPALGKVVADLAGWNHGDDDDNVGIGGGGGVRLAQDQVWAKPPGAPPLTFHRDAPYFMFTPDHVMTVWIALDDMDAEIGPLEYVRGSHVWGNGRVGSANQFFSLDRGWSLLHSAAARAKGIASSTSDDNELEIISMAGLKAGGISIHDGRTWHGSGRNNSCHRPRRGIGIHYVPANVRFTPDAAKSRLWKQYVVPAVQNEEEEDGVVSMSMSNEDVAKVELPEEDFPITWKEVHDTSMKTNKSNNVA
jgi:phytanoyl-CoA hydroxylase